MAIGLWFADSAAAQSQSEVFRCEDPEQGIIFQQTPCPETAAEEEEQDAESSDGELVAAAPENRRRLGEGDSVADVLAEEEEARRESAEVKACKQQYREAIDAIDMEIQNSYTPEQKDYYLERLKMLTDKMKAC